MDELRKGFKSMSEQRRHDLQKPPTDKGEQMLPNWPKEREKKFCNCDMEAEPSQYCGCKIDDYNKALALCLPIAEKLQKERDIYKKALEKIANSQGGWCSHNYIADEALKDGVL